VRTLAVPLPRMKRSVGVSVSARRSGGSVPARFGTMARVARGADFTTTLPFAKDLQEVALESGSEPDDGIPLVLRVVVFNPPGGCERPCLPRPRGPSARTATGCR